MRTIPKDGLRDIRKLEVKTRQEQTRQMKTRQDKRRQDKRTQNKTRSDKRIQNKVMTRQGKTKTDGFLCCFFWPRRVRDEDDAERRPERDKKT